jgi:hypothetical protein
MISAFGVDHGEISKAVRLRVVRVGKPRVPRGTRTRKGKRLNAAQRRTASPPGQAPQTGPQKIRTGMQRITEAPITIAGVGRGTSRVGQTASNFTARHPGLTGAGILGGGGFAGYKYLSNKEPRRKKEA